MTWSGSLRAEVLMLHEKENVFESGGPKERRETQTYIADHIITSGNTRLVPFSSVSAQKLLLLLCLLSVILP